MFNFNNNNKQNNNFVSDNLAAHYDNLKKDLKRADECGSQGEATKRKR